MQKTQDYFHNFNTFYTLLHRVSILVSVSDSKDISLQLIIIVIIIFIKCNRDASISCCLN